MTHETFIVVDVTDPMDRSHYVPNHDAAIRARQSAERAAERAAVKAANIARNKAWRAARAAKRYAETVTVDTVADGDTLAMLARIASR